MTEFADAPIDHAAAAALSAQGLSLVLVDTTDAMQFEAWLRADARGFHGAEPSGENIAESIATVADRRTTGVWDHGIAGEALPIATVSSWPVAITVPGHTTVDAWAISSVTVSPTHRRRGIARQLLEGELRTAHALGLPMAALTVSESTIYGRFGFAPAAFATNLTIDTSRARWTGPSAPGRIVFLSRTQFRAEVAAMHERVRLDSPGQIPAWGGRWDQLSGLAHDDAQKSASLRAVRYDDSDGVVRGLALYRVTEPSGDSTGDFAKHTLTVEYLSHETDEAYSALWRYLLEVDLVGKVTAVHRPVDEPVLWNIGDRRAAVQSTWDHLWLRILDVAAALESRGYAAAGRLVLSVDDELGYAAGHYAIEVDGSGVARVTQAEARDAPSIRLGIDSLSALYLGGVSATTLASAGLLSGEPAHVALLDAMFHSSRVPWLSIWF